MSWAKPDSDNALFGKDDSSAVPPWGSLRSLIDPIAFLVPGDACRRGYAFGLRACEIESRKKKVACLDWHSNLLEILR